MICQVRIIQQGKVVSNRHAEIFFDGVTWCIRDLNSTNGTYLNEVRIQQAHITQRVKVKLGKSSPYIWIEPIANQSYQNDVKRHLNPRNTSMDSETANAIHKAFKPLSRASNPMCRY